MLAHLVEQQVAIEIARVQLNLDISRSVRDRKTSGLEHDLEKWVPVFRKIMLKQEDERRVSSRAPSPLPAPARLGKK